MKVENELVYTKSKNGREWIIAGASGASGAAVGFSLISQPAQAQTASNTAVSDINAMVTSLGTIAAGVTTVVLAAMVVRLGIKFVNRMTVKG